MPIYFGKLRKVKVADKHSVGGPLLLQNPFLKFCTSREKRILSLSQRLKLNFHFLSIGNSI
jgi:hypothetical protein